MESSIFRNGTELQLSQVMDGYIQYVVDGVLDVDSYITLATFSRFKQQYAEGNFFDIVPRSTEGLETRIYINDLYEAMDTFYRTGRAPKKWRTLISTARTERALEKVREELFIQGYLSTGDMYGLFRYDVCAKIHWEFKFARSNYTGVEHIYKRLMELYHQKPKKFPPRGKALLLNQPLTGRVYPSIYRNDLVWEDVLQTEKPYVFTGKRFNDGAHIFLNFFSDPHYYDEVRIERKEILDHLIERYNLARNY